MKYTTAGNLLLLLSLLLGIPIGIATGNEGDSPQEQTRAVIEAASDSLGYGGRSIIVRFTAPVVSPETAGTTVDAATVLEIRPPLSGRFRWTGTRSGIFEPDAPLALGSEYRLTTRKDLKDAQGNPVVAADPASLSTPPLQVHTYTPRWFTTHRDDPHRPLIRLYFNDSVSAESLEASAYFEDRKRNRRSVTARQAVRREVDADPHRTGPWEHQAIPPARREAEPHDPEAPVVSAVAVQPAQALPPGENWTLVLPAGFPNLRNTARTASDLRIHYGNVYPLNFTEAQAEPRLNGRRALHIRFNKRLEPEVGDLPEWIRIQPEPANAEWEKQNSGVTVLGDFALGRSYEVTVKEGLPAADGTTLEANGYSTVKFTPHEPRLSLPVFNNVQWLGGRGDFPFIAANLSTATVKVKRVSAEHAVFLLNGYRTYEHEDEPYSEQNTRIPYGAIAGKTVFEKQFESQVELDCSERFQFTWEEVGGGVRQPGIYFVSIEGTPKEALHSRSVLGAQSVVQLSDIGLAWKASGDDALVYAFSHSTGQPLQGVQLRTFTDEAEPVGSATTGADGLARLNFGSGRWLLAERNGDLHGIPFHAEVHGLNMWAFGMPLSWRRPDQASRELMFFTERPVYQPGDTVYFKAIARMHAGTTLTVPTARSATLKLLDTGGRTVHERSIELSETGTYADSVRLPADSQGWFRILIQFPRPDGNSAADGDGGSDEEDWEDEFENPGSQRTDFTHYVLVQPYQPNSFRITFDEKAATLEDETLRVPVHAAYLMGKALSNAEVTWASRIVRGGFYPSSYPGFRFGDWDSTYVHDGTQYFSLSDYTHVPEPEPLVTGQGTITLSARGEGVLDVPASRKALPPGPASIGIDASITDLNQQTITGSWTYTDHSSDWYLGVKPPSQLVSANEEVPLDVIAVRPDGTRWDKPVTARVTVEHLVWNAIRLEVAGGGTEVRNTPAFEKFTEAEIPVSPEPGKEHAWSFRPDHAGTHRLTFTAADDQGREVRTVVQVNVYGADWLSWRADSGARIELTPDRESYQAGDTARIIVKTPLEGTALVTVEREGVISASLRQVSPGGVLEFPVEESWEPNVFISVMHIRGGDRDPREHRQPDYRAGFCKLKVTGGRDRLNVEVTPESPEVLPGATVRVTARVTDNRGRKVPNAEVALWAVDEGVLTLVPWEAPDAWQYFHRDCPLFVRTGTTLSALMPEDPDERTFTNKGFVIGGGGEDDMPSESLRRNFKATAYWHGTLMTGDDGTVEVSFPAPDNLTSFRIVAVALEGPARFGTGESSFRVNKPLMLEPALPRFANVGDEVTLKAVLHNTTEREAELTVELTGDEHVRLLDPSSRQPVTGSTVSRTVKLGAMQSKAVPFPVAFVAEGPLTLRWKAAAAGDEELADAVESTFDVGIAEPLLRELRFAVLQSGNNNRNLLTNLEPDLLENKGRVTVTISNSRLIEGAEAIEQLLRYPYGCAEQTTSSMMPWLTLRDLRKALPGLKKTDAEIAEAIQAGCDRLLSMQTAGGGLGYWPGASEPSDWASAHGSLGLVLATKAGANIPADRLNSLLDWLSSSLRNAAEDAPDAGRTERVYAAYALALAGRPEPAYHEVLFRQRDKLDATASAVLALTIAESGGPEDMARAALAASRATRQDYWWGSATTAAARVLTLQALRDPDYVQELNRLVGMRGTRGDWNTTFANSWVLRALAGEATLSPLAVNQRVTCSVSLNGQTSQIELPAEPSSGSVTFDYPAGTTPDLRVTVPDGLALFANVELSTRRGPGEQPGRTQGFAIRRSWNRVNPDGSIDEAGELRTGDLVLVSLDVDVPEPADYVAIDDPLPSTFEGINPHFTSTASTAEEAAAQDQWNSDHREVRRDRVLIFRDHVPTTGTFRVQYLARVVAEGTVMVPSAKVEAMYDPSRFGLSPAVRVTTGASPDDDVAAR